MVCVVPVSVTTLTGPKCGTAEAGDRFVMPQVVAHGVLGNVLCCANTATSVVW